MIFTYRDMTILGAAALAVTICFGLVAGLVGNLQVSFAQEIENVTTTAAATGSATEALLGEVNATIIAISGLMATAIGIVSGAVAWIRSRTGDRIISDGTNEWLQDLFEKIRKEDDSVRDVFRQVLEKSAEIDVVVDIVKRNSPELGEKIDEATPQIQQKLHDIQGKVSHWQQEADKLFEVSPKDDPIKG